MLPSISELQTQWRWRNVSVHLGACSWKGERLRRDQNLCLKELNLSLLVVRPLKGFLCRCALGRGIPFGTLKRFEEVKLQASTLKMPRRDVVFERRPLCFVGNVREDILVFANWNVWGEIKRWKQPAQLWATVVVTGGSVLIHSGEVNRSLVLFFLLCSEVVVFSFPLSTGAHCSVVQGQHFTSCRVFPSHFVKRKNQNRCLVRSVFAGVLGYGKLIIDILSSLCFLCNVLFENYFIKSAPLNLVDAIWLIYLGCRNG